MHHFFYNPEPENNYQPKLGDLVTIRSRVPLYGGRSGKVTSLDHGVTVEFDDGSTCGFDDDEVVLAMNDNSIFSEFWMTDNK